MQLKVEHFFLDDIFYYTRLSRNPFLNSKEKIDKYVTKLSSNGIDGITKEINIYLGLLKSEEREDFIQWMINSYPIIISR